MLENPQAIKDALIQWIRDYFSQNGPNCLIGWAKTVQSRQPDHSAEI